MNLCARCRVNFPTVKAFDAHPCMTASLDPAAMTVLRERRRTSVITMDRPGKPGGPDIIRVCEPDCRNEFLLDLGIKGGRGGWVYPSHGTATATVTNTGNTYEVTWKRCPPSALRCDLCAHQWRYRVPAAITAAAASASVPLTAGRRAVLAEGRAALAARRITAKV